MGIMFGLTTLIALVCVVVGLLLARMTWWFWNAARPESPALAPLEIMSDKRYGRSDDAQRSALLDRFRFDPAMKSGVQRPQVKTNRSVRPVEHELVEHELVEHELIAPVDNRSHIAIDPLLK